MQIADQSEVQNMRSKRQALTPDELLRVLQAAKDHSTRDWLLLLMIYRHGLRASEAASLCLESIKDGHLDIHRLKGSLHSIQAVERHPGQPLLDESRALNAWLKVRPPDGGSNVLFVSRKGGHLTREQVYRIFRQHAKTAGLPPQKRFVHILKHSLATHLVNADVNLAKVQVALGHASLSSTQAYVHITDEQAAEVTRAALMRVF
jgi:type 1 fimbriae regulatory protein FimB